MKARPILFSMIRKDDIARAQKRIRDRERKRIEKALYRERMKVQMVQQRALAARIDQFLRAPLPPRAA